MAASPSQLIDLTGGRNFESALLLSRSPLSAISGLLRWWIRAYTTPTHFHECAVRRHEPLDHWHDQLRRISDRLPCTLVKHLRVDDEVAMHIGRQFDADLDRLVVGERPELELGHGFPPARRAPALGRA